MNPAYLSVQLRSNLVVTDYYSRYLEIAYLPNLSCGTVVAKLKSIFAIWWIPEILISGNCPPFSAAAFESSSNQYGFTHVTSSPYLPEANGEAESAVKIARKILKQEDPFTTLMVYWATPISEPINDGTTTPYDSAVVEVEIWNQNGFFWNHYCACSMIGREIRHTTASKFFPNYA